MGRRTRGGCQKERQRRAFGIHGELCKAVGPRGDHPQRPHQGTGSSVTTLGGAATLITACASPAMHA